MVPVSDGRVETGYCDSWARISLHRTVRDRLYRVAFARAGAALAEYTGGLCSSFSIRMPSRLIFALMLRSAEQETPIPTGQEAP